MRASMLADARGKAWFLRGVLVRDGIVVGHVGGRSGRQGLFCGGHVCGCVCGREIWFFAMGELAKGQRGAFDNTERRCPAHSGR